MTNLASWQEGNGRYLATAVAWLRLCLERRAGEEPGPLALPAEPPKPVPKSVWRQLMRRTSAGLPPSRFLLPAGPSSRNDEQVAQAAANMAAAESQSEPPALIILAQRFGLTRFERDVLLLCAAMELDTTIAALCARAQQDPSRPYPTFALALSLFDEPAWDVLSPERPLRYWRLIEINQPGAQPLTTSAVRADERVVNYLKGLNYFDDRLAPLLVPLQAPQGEVELPPSQRQAAETIVYYLKQAVSAQSSPVIQLLGPDAPSKQLVAWQAAASLGLQAFRLPAGQLPTQAAELETLARLWQRDTLLLPVVLYLDVRGIEAGTPSDAQANSVSRFLARNNSLVLLDSRDAWPGLGPAWLKLDIDKPRPGEQREAWVQALGPAAGDSPARLAGQFNLNFTTIREIAHTVLSETRSDDRGLLGCLWDACVASARPQLDALARRLDPKAFWDDIVLPAAEINLLHDIAHQVAQRSTVYEDWGFRQKMNRGLGINALFAGESGTGKTMAAEVIANDLRLNLYRIDLSAVVNKYIGETEKNLRRLFDAAEDGGAILFFDEADALFGKRSEVKDSHDRYANIEINYLLQRMEAYRGLAILATNMKSALDSAFLRRLRFVVNFPFPGPAERKAIWQKVFPRETPTVGLDFQRLARLNLTGGSIHNIALNAAFLAAQANTPVTMPLVLDAARTEFRKLERPINEADFRWQVAAGAVA